MPVTVVVGGQYGSEGKGKVAHYFAKTLGAAAAVRVGGPNSGHTVISDAGRPIIFRQLPTAALLPDVYCVLPAGSYLLPELLLQEMSLAGLAAERLVVDPNAVVISEREREAEESSNLRSAIGSTLSGTGAAVVARVMRHGHVVRARDSDLLRPFIRPATQFLRELLRCKERVIVEGTQGFGLSALHSPHYPFVTSRDTTAAGFVSEGGLSPLDVDDVVLVIRAFPIRVAGNSGPLSNEISWGDITKESGSRLPVIEHTSVTKTVRRIGRFDPQIVHQAVLYNSPTKTVLNHLDHVDARCGLAEYLTPRAIDFVRRVESLVETSIDYVGLGPNRLTKFSDRLGCTQVA